MGIITTVLTVFFFILCLLLIIIILLQSDKSAGMGILGGSSQTTFGSSTADVITKITAVMAGIFMVGSLGLSVLESYRSREFDPTTVKAERTLRRVPVQGQQQDNAVQEKVQVNKEAGKDVPASERNVLHNKAGQEGK
ncbi:MAG TPA: preprotein translocase subunit SecG [Spirochaetota bacterium]|nr:preprotein translocase subunit SecG [Spirochaetota bacterium]HQP49534.1 preprotein translocase subunit SecG [Spirochaetota bacterium]